MGSALHQENGKADGGRHSGDRPVHVRSEDMGLVSSTTGASQEAHEVHDELETRRIRAEEEV